MTEFQKRLSQDKETLWKIVKVFHPEIPDTAKERIKEGGLLYDWVTISMRIKGYGYISLGIDNCYQTKLYGPYITKEKMQKALIDGTVTFRIWRFADDVKSRPYSVTNSLHEPEMEEGIKILKEAGYKLQSASEMYKIYYED